MKFQAVIQLNGKTATGIAVPDAIIEGLSAGKRPKVRVTIGAYTYRTSIGSVDGEAMIPISGENRAGAGVAAGDTVEVQIEIDTEPREVVVSPDFAAALANDPEAKRIFEGLSFSHQQQHVLPIEQARTPETRARRIEKSMGMLREGKG